MSPVRRTEIFLICSDDFTDSSYRRGQRSAAWSGTQCSEAGLGSLL